MYKKDMEHTYNGILPSHQNSENRHQKSEAIFEVTNTNSKIIFSNKYLQ